MFCAFNVLPLVALTRVGNQTALAFSDYRAKNRVGICVKDNRSRLLCTSPLLVPARDAHREARIFSKQQHVRAVVWDELLQVINERFKNRIEVERARESFAGQAHHFCHAARLLLALNQSRFLNCYGRVIGKHLKQFHVCLCKPALLAFTDDADYADDATLPFNRRGENACEHLLTRVNARGVRPLAIIINNERLAHFSHPPGGAFAVAKRHACVISRKVVTDHATNFSQFRVAEVHTSGWSFQQLCGALDYNPQQRRQVVLCGNIEQHRLQRSHLFGPLLDNFLRPLALSHVAKEPITSRDLPVLLVRGGVSFDEDCAAIFCDKRSLKVLKRLPGHHAREQLAAMLNRIGMNDVENVQSPRFFIGVAECLLPRAVDEQKAAVGRDRLNHVESTFDERAISLFAFAQHLSFLIELVNHHVRVLAIKLFGRRRRDGSSGLAERLLNDAQYFLRLGWFC